MNEKKNNGRIVFLLSFLLPVLALLLIFFVKDIYPFGDNSFLRTDMYHQYAPFFAEFAEKLQNGESLLYSWRVGAGSNFLTLLAYYLLSPFNLALFFLSKPAVIEFMTYLIVFKTGLSGLTMAWYLCRKFRTRTIAAALFAMAYALSGYMAAYSWNIMWLDCIWLAPLVLLGLEQLVEENKGLLYCLTLSLSILTNYYISIMLCLFLVFYFLCLLIMYPSRREQLSVGENKTGFKQYLFKCLQFAFYSLLAGGIAAVILLPVMLALKTTASSNINFPDSLSTYFPMIDMVARHMAGVETEIGLEHWPNLYSCAAVFVLAPLYIMNKSIPFKEKIVKCLLLLFLLVSFAWNIPNFIWHGFHYPNSLPCRQSFLYTIVLLAMCFEAFIHLRTASLAQIVGSVWGAIAFIFLSEKVVEAEEFRFYVFYINILLVGLYGLFLYLHKRRRAAVSTLCVLAFSVVFLEMGLNMGITSITTTSRSSYLRNTESFQRLAQTAENAEGSVFFRMEKAVKKTKNDGAWAGYRSASIFSSTTNAAITTVYKQLGMEGSTNAYSFTGATPFVQALLSVKYTLAETPDAETPLTTWIATDGAVSLYRNDYTLPLGFMIPESASEWNHQDTNPIQVQNNFVACTTAVGSVFTMVHSGNGSSYTFTAPQDGYYYGVLTDFSVKNITADFAERSTTYSNVDRDFILDLGYLKGGESVTLSGDDDKSVCISMYRLLQEEFIDAVSQLNEEPLLVDSYTDTRIEGRVTALSDGLLFTSIPYEEGWTVYVDGAAVETQAYADAFLSIALPAGDHAICMEYMPAGLKQGAALSLVSLLILLLTVAVTIFRLRAAKRPSLDEQRRLRFHKEDTKGTEDAPADSSTAKQADAAEDASVPEKKPVTEETSASEGAHASEKTQASEKISASEKTQASKKMSVPEKTSMPKDSSASEGTQAPETETSAPEAKIIRRRRQRLRPAQRRLRTNRPRPRIRNGY